MDAIFAVTNATYVVAKIRSLLVSVKIAQSQRFAFSNEPLDLLDLITSCYLGNETALHSHGDFLLRGMQIRLEKAKEITTVVNGLHYTNK